MGKQVKLLKIVLVKEIGIMSLLRQEKKEILRMSFWGKRTKKNEGESNSRCFNP